MTPRWASFRKKLRFFGLFFRLLYAGVSRSCSATIIILWRLARVYIGNRALNSLGKYTRTHVGLQSVVHPGTTAAFFVYYLLSRRCNNCRHQFSRLADYRVVYYTYTVTRCNTKHSVLKGFPLNKSVLQNPYIFLIRDSHAECIRIHTLRIVD